MATTAGNVWEYSIRELINKRIVTFRHLRNAMTLPPELSAEGTGGTHSSDLAEGTTHSSRGMRRRAYFNALMFDADDLRGMFNSIRLRKRTRAYFMLGASLGPILAISNPADYIKALGILISEYDTFMAESGSKAKKPFDLDFLQVFDTFCQITVIMYTKLADSLLSIAITQSAFDSIAKIDSRFKKIIGTVTKELDELLKNAITKELRLIDPLDMASPENEINTDWETSSVYK
ncbi:hypothetical protein H4R23_001049 [Coemansia sp. Cherry 401B]|nr:hypothetical protein H4R23_001049 [Coemansia sp. Cherry 401B]